MSNSEKLFHCPKCKHEKKKLSINIDKDVFKCWVCDFSGKSLNFLVKKYGSRNHISEWKTFNKVDMSETDVLDDIFKPEEKPNKVTDLDLPIGFVSLSSGSPDARQAMAYLRSRGLTHRDILMWKLGFATTDEYSKRIIIPSFDSEGNLNYFVGRTYDEDSWPRYKNPNSSKDIIFNDLLIDWSRPVTLVEGPFDAIAAPNAIALLGSTLRENSKLFQKIIEHKPVVYVALDEDAYDKSLKICKILAKYDINTKIIILKEKDLGDMPEEEIENLYNTASIIDSDNYLLYEINKI